MMTIIEKILGLTWLGDVADMLNGNKTMLGLIALVIHLLNIVPTYFPQFGFTPEIADSINQVLMYMGVMLPWGGAHKLAKAITVRGK